MNEDKLNTYQCYEDNSGKLYHGDCLELMKLLPDGKFDAIITDPPYNVSNTTVITRKGGRFGKAKDVVMDFGDWDRGSLQPDDFLEDFVRLLTPNGVLIMFHDRPWVGVVGLYLQKKFGFQIRHIGAWVKANPTPQARKVKWQTGTEMFLVATKNKGTGHHFNYKLGQSPDYMILPVEPHEFHPTQKPEKLMTWLVQYWTFENDFILDPLAGSGTTCVAAKKLGRNYIGIDKEKKYIDLAAQRLKKSYKVRSLFG